MTGRLIPQLITAMYPAWKQKLSLVILLLTLLAMIFEKKIGIKLYVSGCMGALALIITGVISEKQALNSIDLKTIFLFGGTLSLAAALEKTGAGEMVAEKVMHLLGENPSPYVLTFAVFMLCCIMTNFMSNTATTALLVPICVSIAQGMGADPRAVLMACVIGGSCAYATPIGNAGKHNGTWSRRLHFLRLYEVRTAVNCDRDHSQHDHFTNCISIFPISCFMGT